ncbi:ABC transporter, CydDC cysteine exporter (CydDC- E) family, permease/ATP-binding protein CydD [Cellulomonas flavigena DSM 20109]|uniref:ABC transporter, CydDC cysteine exporter (CydDC-E) family, permease/ATP-binding protein CydD n=1 Tax=Cellulomonas flavigena (strain ATCC 482 / DSM 20109 / BCRC 11376 / JCM 18109 / NBRC 3775 / NCIMB 8073 / NRS 134) TaxID=446466 RepID=D5UGT0_CELFN|nr:thiol reductant ABC exporter subunit CydD [Cellulomonas flavigena]ADG75178.1 ABC transporter, CydDC cysteine exporter (CydDC- E) family, permease/ATP-binding protein CydD [Cellulomonas flavigena DSM 20109]
MKPLDPRLLRHARSARGYLALTVGLGLATGALVVAQALLLAHALGSAVAEGATLADVTPLVAALVGVVLLRVLATGVQERYAHRAATRAVAELRERVVAHAAAVGPRRAAPADGAGLVTLATRGLDALEPYFVRYLPQLVLAATLTPATLLVVLGLDGVSAAIIAGTVPLVPLFMWLVGVMTQGRSERGLATMQRLGAQVLDLLAGLGTLRAFGRERGPVARVRELGDAHRRATMGTLRVAFLSGMVLELLTTLCVALVAVGIGLRLVYGNVDLVTGLAVLVLAPEVFAPLRQVGAHFHASTDGVAAADRAFAVLEVPVPEPGRAPAPDLAAGRVRARGVAVRARGGWAPAPVDVELAPGRVVALVGPSGAGKSTTVEVLLGLLAPDAGHVELVAADGTPTDLRDVDVHDYWRQVTWLPQRPVLEPGTVHELLGSPPPAERDRAAALTGLDTVVAVLPDGWSTVLGGGGAGLSVGQRQRLALTRTLLRPSPVVVLDEPTAHLDAAGEQVVLATLDALRDAGSAVLLVAHRASLTERADDVVHVTTAADDAVVADAGVAR